MLSSLRFVERHELVLVENDFLKSEKDFLAVVVVILKMGHPGLFFVYFRRFTQTLQFLQQIYVKK